MTLDDFVDAEGNRNVSEFFLMFLKYSLFLLQGHHEELTLYFDHIETTPLLDSLNRLKLHGKESNHSHKITVFGNAENFVCKGILYQIIKSKTCLINFALFCLSATVSCYTILALHHKSLNTAKLHLTSSEW